MALQDCGHRIRAASHKFARVILWTCALQLLLAFAPARVGAAAIPVGPTVKDVVEFTRIVQPPNHDNDALQTQVSPNGERAFIVTRKADVATDRNRFELLLLHVAPSRLVASSLESRVRPPQRLISIEATEDLDDAEPFLKNARWVGDRTIAFLGRMPGQPFQVYAVDVDTRRLKQLTFDRQGVVSFDVSDDLRRVVYVAPVPNPPLVSGARSVVVANQSLWSVKFGQQDLRAQHRRYQYRLAEAGYRRSPRRLGESFPESSGYFPRVSISPDGRWALLPRYDAERQREWGARYPMVADMTARFGPGLTQDPLAYYSRPHSYVVRRLVAWRLDDGQPQTIVDAPDDSPPGSSSFRTDRLWQNGGTSVVIAGSFLPQGVSGEPRGSQHSHIIEYWPDSGRWEVIAELQGRLGSVRPVAGQPNAFVAVDASTARSFSRTAQGGWQEASVAGEVSSTNRSSDSVRMAWTLRIDEALNRPPDVVAVGAGGRTVRLTELNPQFSASTWGTIQPYSWKDAKGRPWDGGLMVPSRSVPGERRALVIQTYGFSPNRFYLDGPNEFNGATSGFAGRAFSRQDILVLALPWTATKDGPTDEHGALSGFMDGVRGAVEALVAEGQVDRERVGIIGWSATGERVLNLLTFSDVPVRAATILDGDSNTLFSMAITYAAKDGILTRKERINEGGPFGDAMQRWVRNDPSLHTDCVKAALRIETYGPMVLNNWDIYALLRRQYKPAEMVVIPAGAHALSRPSERMISLQGNVDWYRFWLKDEERSDLLLAGETDAALNGQYARWREMATLKRADDARPRCARVAEGG